MKVERISIQGEHGAVVIRTHGNDGSVHEASLTALEATHLLAPLLAAAKSLPELPPGAHPVAVIQGQVEIAPDASLNPGLLLTIGGLRIGIPLSPESISHLLDQAIQLAHPSRQ